jgi:hypothetical protein
MGDSPDTVTEALALLQAEGYTADFNLEGTAATCSACRHRHALEGAHVQRQYRFEGDSDPGDEAIVLGVRCPACGALGVIVSAYGPDADPELLQQLDDHA